MPEPSLPEAVNPDDLMLGVRRGSFLAILLISVGVHLVLIFGTSIGYMRLMRRYKSWHPRIEMKRVAKQRPRAKASPTREPPSPKRAQGKG